MTRPVPSRLRVCAVCGGMATHATGCLGPALEAELQALAAAVGLFVCDVRERLETLDRLLHAPVD